MKTVAKALLLAFLTGGCATINISREGGVTMAEISNTGWFLFSFIPLGSGNPEKPDSFSFKCFRNTATLENNMDMVRRAMKTSGAKSVKNLTSVTTDEKIFIVLLRRFSFHTSCELIYEEEPPRKDL